MVALLSGCYSYRMDRTANPVKLPEAWDSQSVAGTAKAVDKEWWKSFGSPVLNDLVAQALKDNPGIIATEERLKQAERTFSQARDGLYPEVSLSASTSKGLSGTTGTPDNFVTNPITHVVTNSGDDNLRATQSTSLSVSSSYTVDLWGGTAAKFRASVASLIGTRYDAETAHIQLAAQVARAYFSLLSVRSRVEISRQNLVIAERLLKLAQAKYDNGVSRQYDLAQQKTTVLSQRAQLIPLENQMRQAETALGILLGRTPQDFHVAGEPIDSLKVPEIAPWLPSDLLFRRADMASAETTMASAKANLASARAALIPVTLTISTSLSKNTTQELLNLTDPTNYSLSGAIRLAEGIFSHRQRKNAVLNAESNEYIALINYAQTIRSALKDVDDNLANAAANLKSEEAQAETTANAKRALELAEVSAREGTANQQELSDAQRTLYSAQDSLAQARLTRLNTAVQLFQSLGGGWVAPAEPRP